MAELSKLFDSEISNALSEYQLLNQDSQCKASLIEAAKACADAIKAGGTVFFAGNGGSFADAQHMAAELTGKMGRMRSSLPGLVLGSNNSSMSAIGNDFGFDEVFSRELEGLFRPNSTVVGFSTSGRSRNILNLAEMSKKLGLKMFCFTGKEDGPISNLATTIRVPSDRTERIQEMHTLLGHLMCLMIEEELQLFS